MKKIKIPDLVLSFLQSKGGVAVTKENICKGLDLNKSSVDRACSILRKNELVGMFRTHMSNLGFFRVKTYWSAKV